jgi:hypothetical protein
MTISSALGVAFGQVQDIASSAHKFMTSIVNGIPILAQPAFTDISGIVSVAAGGTGTATPALVAGSNITISGSWPNQTVNSSGGGGGVAVNVTPSIYTVTAQTSATICTVTSGCTAAGISPTTGHGFGVDPTYSCWDNATPRNYVVCAASRDSSGNLIFTFSPAFTGIIQVGDPSGTVWPAAPGITVCTGTPCTAWGTSLTAPTGAIVGVGQANTYTVTQTIPLSAVTIPCVVGSIGVTQYHLVKLDTNGTCIPVVSTESIWGIAMATGTTGQTVSIAQLGPTSCVTTGTTTLGHYLQGSGTDDTCSDTGQTALSSVLQTTPVIGKATASGTTGQTITVDVMGSFRRGEETVLTSVSGILPVVNGGTGIANNAANTITFSGNYGLTMTLSGATSVTLPTSGTLVYQGGPLGTPSSGVLTNATGLPNASVIGLGTAALVNTGTIGATVPLNNGANTWGAQQIISAPDGPPQLKIIDSTAGLPGIELWEGVPSGSGARNWGIYHDQLGGLAGRGSLSFTVSASNSTAPSVTEATIYADGCFYLGTSAIAADCGTHGLQVAGNVGIGGSPVSPLTIPIAPTATANYGTLSVGSGPIDGTTTGKFVGSAAGTQLAINAASGSTADMANWQVAGIRKLEVDSSGSGDFAGSVATDAVLTANLKTCTATTGTPWRAAVSDATAPALGVALTGGGAVFALVHCSLTTGTYLVDGM